MLTIAGYSDDLIEVEGDIDEEFTAYNEGKTYLGFSNGTLASVEYSDEGIWRIAVLVAGDCTPELVPCIPDDGDGYSDRLTIPTPVSWAIQGTGYVKAGPR